MEPGPANGPGTTFATSAHTRLFGRSLIHVEASDPPVSLVSDCLDDEGASPLVDVAGREKERERREAAMVDAPGSTFRKMMNVACNGTST